MENIEIKAVEHAKLNEKINSASNVSSNMSHYDKDKKNITNNFTVNPELIDNIDGKAKLISILLRTQFISRINYSVLWLTILCLLSCGNTIIAQSYIDDARNLVKFSELYKGNAALINIYKDDFLTQILVQKRSTGFDTGTTNNVEGGGAVFPEGEGTSAGRPIESQPESIRFNQLAIKKLKKELDIYVAFLNFESSYIQNSKFKQEIDNVPDSFEYLIPTIQVLEHNMIAAKGTSGLGVGSLIGVSQSQILQGITDWALNRAQEELMQAFLREWLEKLQNDELLREAFPNSLTMLSTSDLSSIYTDGETWKATFKQDLDNFPNNVPAIAELILHKLNVTVSVNAKADLIFGLTAISTLFKEISKNKKPDEILMLLGEESFVNNASSGKYKPVIDRSLVGLNVFLSSIQSLENGEIKYTLPGELLRLSEDELKMLWNVIYSRERKKLRFSFDLDDANEEAFYKSVSSNVQKLRIQLTKASETINSFNNLLLKVSSLEDKKFTVDQFNSYILLVFDLVENGISSIELLTNNKLEIEKIKLYKQRYLEGFKIVATLYEGIKTKAYGKVALNTLNFVMWMKDYAIEEDYGSLSKIIEITEIANLLNSGMTKSKAKEILVRAQSNLTIKLVKYPNTNIIVQEKFNILKLKLLEDSFNFDATSVKELIDDFLNCSDEESRVIFKEMAEKEFLELQSSSESLNKYSKLMASVILAENSEDIQEALDGVAMKTGGYLVKQHSYFSATVSFYPGIEYGQEQIEGTNGLSSSNGSYIGATLPIGIELALGTNWKPIATVGLFVQVLDLGAVLNYSLSNDNVSTNPEFGFEQVLSPGAYLTLHLVNNPITLGAGASYSPSLREVNNLTTTLQANALQIGFFVAVDLNVFTIYGSRKKIALKSKSRMKSYENK
jgi:hypothetical protein